MFSANISISLQLTFILEIRELFETDIRFRDLNMTEFSIQTVPDITIIYCMYHRNDCRADWKPVLTNNGFCIVFNNDTDTVPHPKISVGRQTSLSFMLGFNDSG